MALGLFRRSRPFPFEGAAAGDLLLHPRVQEENIIEGQEDDDDAEAGDVAPRERDDGVGQEGQKGPQV